jgi:hypothetical protein
MQIQTLSTTDIISLQKQGLLAYFYSLTVAVTRKENHALYFFILTSSVYSLWVWKVTVSPTDTQLDTRTLGRTSLDEVSARTQRPLAAQHATFTGHKHPFPPA